MMWDLIFAVVTSGGLSSAITWIVSKRKRNNDFITDLQNSINLLSDNYTKTLDSLIVVKKQNNDLIILVTQLENELNKLKEENSSLIKKMNEFISQLEPEMAKLKEENSTLIKKMNELKRMLSKQ
ncbi:hypothetical protein RZS08_27560 [Arthrospira platensis SPKY1]|nr:hypothetical protein [Arthrospira platensis SPKY1]